MALRGRGVEISPPNLAKTTTEENARACKIGSFFIEFKNCNNGKRKTKDIGRSKSDEGNGSALPDVE